MALSIYESAVPTTVFSEDGTLTNPISITIDGLRGGVILRRYYVRNDDNTKYYTSITLQPIVNSGLNIVNGSINGFSWKLIEGDTQPLDDQWAITTSGNQISLTNIGTAGNGDTTTYLPFWLRVDVPRNVDVQSFSNVSLEINSISNNV